MPIYEFYCPQNNKLYQFLARSLSYRDAVPLCPDNPDFVLEKRVSQEAGEDPEKLENHFGDSDEFHPDADPFFARVKKIIRGARQPIRDPKLYELSEWLRQ